MKNNQTKNNQTGFSLIEIMISVGLLGLISLGVMELTKESNKFSMQQKAKLDESQLMGLLQNKLANKTVCEANFKGKDLSLITSIEKLKDYHLDAQGLEHTEEFLSINNEYFGESQLLKISSIKINYLDSNSWFDVVVTLQKTQSDKGLQEINRTFRIYAQIAGNIVTECMGTLSTGSSSGSLSGYLCAPNLAENGTDSMVQISDPANPSAEICIRKALDPEGCSLLGNEVTTGFVYNSTTYSYDHKCKSTIASFICPLGFLMGFAATGDLNCAPLTVNKIFPAFKDDPLDCGSGGAMLGFAIGGNNAVRILCTPVPTPSPTAAPIATGLSLPGSNKLVWNDPPVTFFMPSYPVSSNPHQRYVKPLLVNALGTPIADAAILSTYKIKDYYFVDPLCKFPSTFAITQRNCDNTPMSSNPEVCYSNGFSSILSQADYVRVCTDAGLCNDCMSFTGAPPVGGGSGSHTMQPPGGPGGSYLNLPTPTPSPTPTETPTPTSSPTPTATPTPGNPATGCTNPVCNSCVKYETGELKMSWSNQATCGSTCIKTIKKGNIKIEKLGSSTQLCSSLLWDEDCSFSLVSNNDRLYLKISCKDLQWSSDPLQNSGSAIFTVSEMINDTGVNVGLRYDDGTGEKVFNGQVTCLGACLPLNKHRLCYTAGNIGVTQGASVCLP